MLGVKIIKKMVLFIFCFYISYLYLNREDREQEENKMSKLSIKKNEDIIKDEFTVETEEYRTEALDLTIEQSESQSEQMADEVKTDDDGSK